MVYYDVAGIVINNSKKHLHNHRKFGVSLSVTTNIEIVDRFVSHVCQLYYLIQFVSLILFGTN